MTPIAAESIVRVSYREVKEESYRALRQAGYSWGIAQVAGRCAGMAQVLFGTGVQAIVKDAGRRGAQNRPARSRRRAGKVIIHARGMSWITVGPFAVATAVDDKRPVVWVRGPRVGPELATVIWDFKLNAETLVSWGSKIPGGWNAFELGPDGAIYASTAPLDRLGKTPFSASWFVCVGPSSPGAVLLPMAEKLASVAKAQLEGVSIGASDWRALETLSREFLVPE